MLAYHGHINIAMKDVTILYQGGSGGFALYYYLLLTGQYRFDMETVQSMIAQQFPSELAMTPANWKDNEFWPDNFKFKSQSGSTVFLICNPLFNSDMYKQNIQISCNTYRILLYTDLKLQLRMAYEKNAYWFTPISRRQFNAPNNTKHYIKQIIDSGVLYNNCVIDPMIPEIVKYFVPDQLVNLADFIKTKTIPGFASPGQQQIDFLNHWQSIQTAKSTILLNS